MDSQEEPGEHAIVSGPPKDPFRLVYCIFFLLGVSYVMPFTTFTTAIDYFELLYPTRQVNRVFSVAYMAPSLITIFLLSIWGRNVPFQLRAYVGLGFSASILIVAPAMGFFFIANASGTSATYAITVVCVAVVGAMSCLTEGSIIGVAGELPPGYMQAVMAGSAASGVITGVLRLVSRVVMPQTQAGVVASAYLYFLAGAIILLACIAGYHLVTKLPMMQYHSELKRSTTENVSLLNHRTHSYDERGFTGKDGAIQFPRKMKPLSYIQVWKRIQGLALSVGFVYVVSVSIFPGHITEDFYSSYFGDLYPILLILCFYLFDFFGKCLPNIPGFISRGAATGGSLARALFFPLFYLCIYGPSFFQTEAAVMILTSLFGLTNGYCMTCAMMISPKCVSLEEAEVAGFLMVMLIKVGLVAGSIVEWIWIL